jgi:hypothetical protein
MAFYMQPTPTATHSTVKELLVYVFSMRFAMNNYNEEELAFGEKRLVGKVPILPP